MVEFGDNQYAMLFNPLLENDGGPKREVPPGLQRIAPRLQRYAVDDYRQVFSVNQQASGPAALLAPIPKAALFLLSANARRARDSAYRPNNFPFF